MTIDIIDLDIGNVSSITNMLGHLGIPSKIITNAEELEESKILILPGVGSYDTGMQALEQNGILNTLIKKVCNDGIPILGICLGAQLLLENSEEGSKKGLGFVKGNCKRFNFTNNDLKIPHMGWKNQIVIRENELFETAKIQKFYFVHSYHFADLDCNDELLLTEYGYKFCSAFKHKNIFGVQFHPEKSHKYGMEFLNNFYKLSTK